MKILKNLFTYIIMIIFTVLICLLLIFNLLESTIFSKNYILSKLDETDYYNKIYNYVESNFEKYIYQSGLDENIIKNIATVDQIKQDTVKIIENIYDNTEQEITAEEIQNNLIKNIENSLEENQTVKESAIEAFAKTIAKEYTNSISHYKYEKNINEGYLKVLETIAKTKKIVLVSIVICILILFILNIKVIYKFMANLGTSLLASGILFIVIKIYINLKINVSNINILNIAISDVLKNIGLELLSMITQYGLILGISGILLIVIPTYIYNLRNKNIDEKNK